MIRSSLVFMVALAGVCAAQTAPPASPATQAPATPTPQTVPKPSPAPAPPDTASTVAPTATVINIKGVCNSTPAAGTAKTAAAKTASSSAPCKTVVTKADFDKLLKAAAPPGQTITPAQRRNLAHAYVELMTFSQAAKKAGLDKDPNFLELMRLVRMQTLQNFYRRNLEEKYRNPPAAEVQAYYNQNLAKYEEIKLSRIFIPAKNPASPSKDDWEKKAAEAANDVHDRAAKGEDFEKLQKEAYTTLGLTITPPSTTMGTRRKGMMAPTDEQELFSLKPGDVSKLEQEPAGYIIYKVESKQMLPLEQVKDEISRELFRQKMDAQLKSITAAVQADYNDQYFGPAAPPPPPPGPRPSMMPPGAKEPPGENGPPKPPAANPGPSTKPPATPPAQPK